MINKRKRKWQKTQQKKEKEKKCIIRKQIRIVAKGMWTHLDQNGKLKQKPKGQYWNHCERLKRNIYRKPIDKLISYQNEHSQWKKPQQQQLQKTNKSVWCQFKMFFFSSFNSYLFDQLFQIMVIAWQQHSSSMKCWTFQFIASGSIYFVSSFG